MKKKVSACSSIKINKSLEQYKDRILFPEKLAKANEMLKEAGLPQKVSLPVKG